jgi:hypothetical protein
MSSIVGSGRRLLLLLLLMGVAAWRGRQVRPHASGKLWGQTRVLVLLLLQEAWRKMQGCLSMCGQL